MDETNHQKISPIIASKIAPSMKILDTERLANPIPFTGADFDADFDADAVETDVDVPLEDVAL